ncbi:MAG: CPBP family intramembrane metalloprotease [Gemmatimonadales bacterium]|nr:CPBP family intramembrane metalloprotease [Gemmatimonadales bacterium]MYG18076.1 CPBP family intramembrane metalloprotease [Gemmatimonadales bacterium]
MNVPEPRAAVNGPGHRRPVRVLHAAPAPRYPSAMPETPTPIAAAYALLLLIGMPLLAAFDARRGADLAAAAKHRRLLYVSVGASLVVLGLVTLGVAAWQNVPAAALGWRVDAPAPALFRGLGVAAVGLLAAWLITAAGRLAGLRETAAVLLLMPRNASEKRWFLALSGIAAVCEEYAYRGFGLWAVSAWTGNPWLGVALVSVSFGLAHGYQKLVGVVRAMALGVVLAATVIWTDSLFPSIVGHFWINAAIGLGGWRHLHANFDVDEPDEPET